MPIVSGEITRDGAVVPVLVGVSQARRAVLERHGIAVPQAVQVRAQLDTGSFATGLMPEVFAALQIGPIDEIAVRTPSTRRGQSWFAEQFDVTLTFFAGTTPHAIGVWAIASEDFQQHDEVQAIIGRDVLDRGIFQYFGTNKSFRLSLEVMNCLRLIRAVRRPGGG